MAWGLKQAFPFISNRASELADELAREPSTLQTLLASHLTSDQELLLFVDQLEDLFTEGFKEKDIQNFLDQLVSTSRDKSNRLRVVITVRSDAIAQLEAFESVLALLKGGITYHLGPVPHRVLLDIIVGPAMAMGYSFESNLVDEIFGDAVEGSDSLLFVAYVLNQLFEKRIGGTFSLNAYKKIRVDARQRIERYKKAAFARTVKERQRELEDYTEDVYQTNLQSRIVLELVEFEKIPFYKDLAWSLRPQVNVLLGRNGYGKSLLIRTLLSLIQQDDEKARKLISDGVGRISLQRNENAMEILFKKEFFEETNSVGKMPVLAIPDGRFVNRSITTISLPGRDHGEPEGKDPGNLARHGAWHFLHEKPYENTIRTLLYALCLDYFQKEHSFDQELFTLLAKVVRYLTDQSFEFDRIERVGRDGFTLYVRTEGNENTPVPIQKASQGTLSVFAIVGLIYDYLRALRPEPDPQSVASRSGIVLIDEIDAHLHPIWQQKILSLLRENFPNVQFIVSAHSPLVVAGCLEDEVAVLRRLPEKGFSLVQFPNDFIGWLPEEIYAKVFQVEGKDETFNRFYALTPFKGKIESRIDVLAKIQLPTMEQKHELYELESQLYYLEKTEGRRSEHDNRTRMAQEHDNLKTKVILLEKKIRELESIQGK
ncbi:MAG: hypothetical protein NPIRA03_39780 [Nitrospirales bacterium]|nr:MAG: hypothetical protein NPIRA03_39780 [Nitrospirales bacterium]